MEDVTEILQSAPLPADPPNGAIEQPQNPVLRWQADNVTGPYLLQIEPGLVDDLPEGDTVSVTTTSVRLTNLAYGTWYTWRVRAENGEWSPLSAFAVRPEPDAPPSGLVLNGKRVDLPLLQQEAAAAGMSLPHGLGVTADRLHTYSDDGRHVDVPAEIAPVVSRHVKPPPPPSPDFGADLPPDYPNQLSAGVSQLRQYLGIATPSAAQNAAAIKLLIRAVFFVLRRSGL